MTLTDFMEAAVTKRVCWPPKAERRMKRCTLSFIGSAKIMLIALLGFARWRPMRAACR